MIQAKFRNHSVFKASELCRLITFSGLLTFVLYFSDPSVPHVPHVFTPRDSSIGGLAFSTVNSLWIALGNPAKDVELRTVPDVLLNDTDFEVEQKKRRRLSKSCVLDIVISDWQARSLACISVRRLWSLVQRHLYIISDPMMFIIYYIYNKHHRIRNSSIRLWLLLHSNRGMKFLDTKSSYFEWITPLRSYYCFDGQLHGELHSI